MSDHTPPFARLSQLPVHEGNGYNYGGDWLISFRNGTTVNFGNDGKLAKIVAERLNNHGRELDQTGDGDE